MVCLAAIWASEQLCHNQRLSRCSASAMAELLASSSKCSAVAEEYLHRHADVLGDLAEQRRGKIPTFGPWDRGAAAMGIAELLV